MVILFFKLLINPYTCYREYVRRGGGGGGGGRLARYDISFLYDNDNG